MVQPTDLDLIGDALAQAYGQLPDETLPDALQVLVDRLFRALSDRYDGRY